MDLMTTAQLKWQDIERPRTIASPRCSLEVMKTLIV